MKQQIEEMYDALVDCDYKKDCPKETNCYMCKAKRLVKEGYQNCKDKVVLTKKEYEDLCVAKDFDYGYHEGEKNMEAYYTNIELHKIRKETAREILEKLLAYVGAKQQFWKVDEKNVTHIDGDKLFKFLDEIAKEHKVEIEQ